MKIDEKKLVDFQNTFVKINIKIINYIYEYYNISYNINLKNRDYNKIFTYFFIEGIINYSRNNPDDVIIINSLDNYKEFYNINIFQKEVKKLSILLQQCMNIPIFCIEDNSLHNKSTGEYEEFLHNIEHKLTDYKFNYKKIKKFIHRKHLEPLLNIIENPKNIVFNK